MHEGRLRSGLKRIRHRQPEYIRNFSKIFSGMLRLFYFLVFSVKILNTENGISVSDVADYYVNGTGFALQTLLFLCLMKSETIMELDFAAGYLIGQFEAAYEYGELSEKQHDELTQIVNYIHEGQREKKENE